MRGRLLVVVLACSALAPAGAARAALQWHAPEPLPSEARSVHLANDGTGIVTGFHAGGPLRYLVRPRGGPPGAPQAFPAGLADGFDATGITFFPNGDALVWFEDGGRIAFRPAGPGSAIGAPQLLPAAHRPQGVAAGASGDALVGMGQCCASSNDAFAALRAPGANGTVDTANEQNFGDGQIVGVALDPGGSAVVVFRNDNALLQSVRAPGASSFGNPAEIAAPGLVPGGYRIRMAVDQATGWALMTWQGKLPADINDFGKKIIATRRAPGGAFETPIEVHEMPLDDIADARPGITSNGAAIVTWNQLNLEYQECDPQQDHDYGAWRATRPPADVWGPPTPVTGQAWPNVGAIERLVSAGDHVAIQGMDSVNTQERCNATDRVDDIWVETAHTGPNGLVFDGKTAFGKIGVADLSVNASGEVLMAYGESQTFKVRAKEDRSAANGGGAGGGGAGGGGGGTGPAGGATPTPPVPRPGPALPGTPPIPPLVPVDLVPVRPLDPGSPSLTVICPPSVPDECSFRAGVFASFGIVPTAAQRRARRATLLGSGSAVVRRGRRGRLKIRFTPAGRKALRGGRRLKVRLKIDVTAGAQRGSFTKATTVKARRKRRG